MKLLLVSNSKELEPGHLVTKRTKKDFLDIYRSNFTKLSIFHYITTGHLIKSGLDYLFQDENELQRVTLPNSEGLDDFWAGIFPYSLVISKGTIIDGNLKHNNKIFKGIFKTERHFNEIVNSLPSTDSEICICDINTINKYIIDKVSTVGIYLVGSGRVLSAMNYSDQMWSHVREGILNVFGNLNVKKIHLSDMTSANAEINISTELKQLSADIGLRFDRRSTYELYSELNGTLDTLKAEQSISELDLVPSLRVLAKQMIDNPTHLKTVKHNISVDISFGVDINLLTRLQGSFDGGYNRVFSLEMTF